MQAWRLGLPAAEDQHLTVPHRDDQPAQYRIYDGLKVCLSFVGAPVTGICASHAGDDDVHVDGWRSEDFPLERIAWGRPRAEHDLGRVVPYRLDGVHAFDGLVEVDVLRPAVVVCGDDVHADAAEETGQGAVTCGDLQATAPTRESS